MHINPLQGHNLYYTDQPVSFWQQEESHPNNRMERTQESAEAYNERCQTCMNRKYVDKSDDSGVSFQVPTRLTPNQAATAVPAHEREHYVREEAKAHREGRDVIHNSIRVFTDVCPECGIQYVSGGEHRIVTRSSSEGEDHHQSHHHQSQENQNNDGFDVSI